MNKRKGKRASKSFKKSQFLLETARELEASKRRILELEKQRGIQESKMVGLVKENEDLKDKFSNLEDQMDGMESSVKKATPFIELKNRTLAYNKALKGDRGSFLLEGVESSKSAVSIKSGISKDGTYVYLTIVTGSKGDIYRGCLNQSKLHMFTLWIENICENAAKTEKAYNDLIEVKNTIEQLHEITTTVKDAGDGAPSEEGVEQ